MHLTLTLLKPALITLTLLILIITSTQSHAQNDALSVYTIDTDTSDIHWRVYKSGMLANLGHNHVIAVTKPTGQIYLSQTLLESRIEMELIVADLIVDNSALRARYGEDFASEPSDDDIAGTRDNMLSKSVLNASHFPGISITGTGLSGYGIDQTINLTIKLLGRTVTVTVPIAVEYITDGVITAHGEFPITHNQLGMKPFSVMLGALQVGNIIDVSFRIRAVQMKPKQETDDLL